jgi:hypothetical protein
MLVIVILILLVHEIGWVVLSLPQNRRQVPQEIFSRGAQLSALQFGFELGTGVRTYLTSVAPYIVASGVMLTSYDLRAAISAGLGFGVGRAGTVILRYFAISQPEWDILLSKSISLVSLVASVLASLFLLTFSGLHTLFS